MANSSSASVDNDIFANPPPLILSEDQAQISGKLKVVSSDVFMNDGWKPLYVKLKRCFQPEFCYFCLTTVTNIHSQV